MSELKRSSEVPASTSGDAEAIEHLKRGIASGKHWFLALLEAIALWTSPEENYNGRHYQYLIGGEAFDWLLLAERLLKEVDSQVPEEEKVALLFGQPPLSLSRREFRELVGEAKYKAYLNYFYGIIVEQALHLAMEQEVWKENSYDPKYYLQDVFIRIYGFSEEELLHWFREERGYPQTESLSLTEYQEFIYWLFKYRVGNLDKARVASDTKKALMFLEQLQRDRRHFI